MKGNDNHIVYVATDRDGNCMYVGEGKPDRYKHLTSGVSHVYEANRWYFIGKFLSVQVIHTGLSKQESVLLEKEEIEKRQPAWNKHEHGTVRLMQICQQVSKHIRAYIHENSKFRKKQDYYITLAKDLCKLLDNNGVTTLAQGQKWNTVDIPTGFMSHLADTSGVYYPVMKHIFDVEKIGTVYKVTLKPIQ